jgi:predicted DNA-binding antitoxin AbrB/MazE fold protein
MIYFNVMNHSIEAIYEDGVFRPLQPVSLAEHERVSLIVSNEVSTESRPKEDEDVIRKQQEASARLRAKMDAIPRGAPQDGLGGADHDLILYGWQK